MQCQENLRRLAQTHDRMCESERRQWGRKATTEGRIVEFLQAGEQGRALSSQHSGQATRSRPLHHGKGLQEVLHLQLSITKCNYELDQCQLHFSS